MFLATQTFKFTTLADTEEKQTQVYEGLSYRMILSYLDWVAQKDIIVQTQL